MMIMILYYLSENCCHYLIGGSLESYVIDGHYDIDISNKLIFVRTETQVITCNGEK